MPTLAYCDVDGVDRTLELGPTPVAVGRNPDCTIRSDDGRVSRYHARFYTQAGAVWVEDLGSANGVWIGAQRISVSPVPIGEPIVIGSLLMRIVDPRFPAQGTPGAHAQLWEWLMMERKGHQGVDAERNAFAQRVGEVHAELAKVRDEMHAARGRIAEAEARAAAAERALAGAEQRGGAAGAAEARATTAERALAAAEQRATAAERAMAATEQRATAAERMLAAAEQKIAAAGERAAASEKAATAAERRAIEAEERARSAASASSAASAAGSGADAARIADLEGELERIKRRLVENDAELDELDRIRSESGQKDARLAEEERLRRAAEAELAELRSRPAPAAAAPPPPPPPAPAGLPAGFSDQLATLGDSVAALRTSLRAIGDETAVMDQSDSVQIVTAAVGSATEELERARDALRSLNALSG